MKSFSDYLEEKMTDAQKKTARSLIRLGDKPKLAVKTAKKEKPRDHEFYRKAYTESFELEEGKQYYYDIHGIRGGRSTKLDSLNHDELDDYMYNNQKNLVNKYAQVKVVRSDGNAVTYDSVGSKLVKSRSVKESLEQLAENSPAVRKAMAHEAGKKAARTGHSYASNPHEKGSEEHTAWSSGHNKARARKAGMREDVEPIEEAKLPKDTDILKDIGDTSHVKQAYALIAKKYKLSDKDAKKAVDKAIAFMESVDFTEESTEEEFSFRCESVKQLDEISSRLLHRAEKKAGREFKQSMKKAQAHLDKKDREGARPHIAKAGKRQDQELKFANKAMDRRSQEHRRGDYGIKEAVVAERNTWDLLKHMAGSKIYSKNYDAALKDMETKGLSAFDAAKRYHKVDARQLQTKFDRNKRTKREA